MKLVIGLIFISTFAIAQESSFSQFHSNPLGLNPANAGNTEGSRLSSGSRLEAVSIKRINNASFVSFDAYSEKLKGGIGIKVFNYYAKWRDGKIVSENLSLYYSPQFKLANNKIIIKPGIGLGISTAKHNYFFYNYLHQPSSINARYNYFNVSTGAIIASKRFYGGFSVFYDRKYYGPDINLHAAYTFGSTTDKGFSVSPAILISTYSDLTIGVNVKYNEFIFGIFNRDYDDLIFALAYLNKKFKLSYSYDYNVNNIDANELMFAWFFNKNQSNPNPIKNTLLF